LGSLGRFVQATPGQCVIHPRPAPVLGVWLLPTPLVFTTELPPVFTTDVSNMVARKGLLR